MNTARKAIHRIVRCGLITVAALAPGLLIPGSAAAADYYVATNGTDANPGTIAQPFRTVHKGIGVLSPGDTLYIRGGTYNESHNAFFARSGTATAPITVKNYSSEVVTFSPSPIIQFSAINYIVLEGVVFNGGSLWLGNGSSHNTFRNLEIKNSSTHGVMESSNGGPLGYNRYINLRIHDNGSSYYDNAMYMNGSNNLYEGIEIYHNCGTAMQIYQSSGLSVDNNVIRNNFIHDTSGAWMVANRPECVTNSGGNIDVGKGQGILIRGSNNQIYNNIVANLDSSSRPCGIGCGGIIAYLSGNNNQIYNNTVYMIKGADGIQVGAGLTNTKVQNNIVYQTTGGVKNDSSSTIASNNLLTDPSFVSGTVNDFRLQSSSGAIDKGTPVPVVSVDFDYAPRPEGAGYDIGAYEHGSTSVSWPAAPTNVRILSTF